MSKRRSSRKTRHLPPLLARLIWSATQAHEDAGGSDIRAVPGALEELGALALWAVPVHGAFAANHPDVDAAIERVAKARFGGGEATRELDEALNVVQDYRDRDEIETAITSIRSADSAAYFYAGLAFGITLASLPSGA